MYATVIGVILCNISVLCVLYLYSMLWTQSLYICQPQLRRHPALLGELCTMLQADELLQDLWQKPCSESMKYGAGVAQL